MWWRVDLVAELPLLTLQFATTSRHKSQARPNGTQPLISRNFPCRRGEFCISGGSCYSALVEHTEIENVTNANFLSSAYSVVEAIRYTNSKQQSPC